MITFGPVPSRRLGRSLGINNIPPKTCSYSCVYCQIGRTTKLQLKRQRFYEVSKILEDVTNTVKNLREKDEKIDFLTFVADGEPTLDINLGEEISELKQMGEKIAVISNASLIGREDVKQDLFKADWVSLKVDAVTKNAWHKINRPPKSLNHEEVLKGIKDFKRRYKGKFVTETMLIKGINDNPQELNEIVQFLFEVKPSKSYISIPIRPPAEKNVTSPSEKSINQAFQIFNRKGLNTEYLIGYEGDEFSGSGDFETVLLNITSVHPMKKQALEELINKHNTSWDKVEQLIAEGKLIEVEYQKDLFYLKKLK